MLTFAGAVGEQPLSGSPATKHAMASKTLPSTGEEDTNPTELVSVETGLCTTSATNVVQKPKDHRGKLGGVCVAVFGVRSLIE